MAMNPGRQVIDDEQLDEALRQIASAAAPGDLPARVLTAIHEEVPQGWVRGWRPAVGVLAVVVLLVVVGVWMNGPDARRDAQGSRHMAQGTGSTARGPEPAPRPPYRRTFRTCGTERRGALEDRVAPPPQRTFAQRTVAPSHLRTRAHAVAEGHEIERLEPPEPLIVARLQMTELSERALQVDALHIPALEVASLER